MHLTHREVSTLLDDLRPLLPSIMPDAIAPADADTAIAAMRQWANRALHGEREELARDPAFWPFFLAISANRWLAELWGAAMDDIRSEASGPRSLYSDAYSNVPELRWVQDMHNDRVADLLRSAQTDSHELRVWALGLLCRYAREDSRAAEGALTALLENPGVQGILLEMAADRSAAERAAVLWAMGKFWERPAELPPVTVLSDVARDAQDSCRQVATAALMSILARQTGSVAWAVRKKTREAVAEAMRSLDALGAWLYGPPHALAFKPVPGLSSVYECLLDGASVKGSFKALPYAGGYRIVFLLEGAGELAGRYVEVTFDEPDDEMKEAVQWHGRPGRALALEPVSTDGSLAVELGVTTRQQAATPEWLDRFYAGLCKNMTLRAVTSRDSRNADGGDAEREVARV